MHRPAREEPHRPRRAQALSGGGVSIASDDPALLARLGRRLAATLRRHHAAGRLRIESGTAGEVVLHFARGPAVELRLFFDPGEVEPGYVCRVLAEKLDLFAGGRTRSAR